MFSRQLPSPTPQPVIPFLHPKVFCVTTIRRLFLEIYDSFSDIRRDLCSSYFYCKSNSLEKKCNLYESFIFISVVWREVCRAGRGEGNQERSSISFDLKWSVVLPVSLTCYVSYHLGCMLLFLLCVLREFAPLFWGVGWGGGYLEAQTGQARWEMVYWSSLYEVLMWWRANSPRRPPRFHPVIWFLKWMGFSIYQHGGLRPDIHKEPLRPHRGCRTSWDLLCQPWVALACMPREKCFAV